jgi:hypothetical protein
MPWFRRRPKSAWEQLHDRPEMRAMREMERLNKLAEQSLPPGHLEFGEAWLAAWATLGSTDPDTLLRKGAGVKGPVYARYRDVWLTQPQTTAADYLRGSWLEIQALCEAQSRCAHCGTVMGNHALDCPNRRGN